MVRALVGIFAIVMIWMVYLWQEGMAGQGNYRYVSYGLHEIFNLVILITVAATWIWLIAVLWRIVRQKRWRRYWALALTLALLAGAQIAYFVWMSGYLSLIHIFRFRHWDFCQIQLNYMDTEHQAGLKGLELARGLGVPVVVMEPVKGGLLAKLPEEVAAPLRVLDPEASDASWALRWVASRPGAAVLLSEMCIRDRLW